VGGESSGGLYPLQRGHSEQGGRSTPTSVTAGRARRRRYL